MLKTLLSLKLLKISLLTLIIFTRPRTVNFRYYRISKEFKNNNSGNNDKLIVLGGIIAKSLV